MTLAIPRRMPYKAELALRSTLVDRGGSLTAEAMETYRRALALKFDDPMQKVWQTQEFLKLLLDERQYEEAVQVAHDAIALDPNNGLPYSLLNKALREAGRHADAAASAKEWAQWAASSQQYDAQAWAEYYAGQSYLALNDNENALAAFQAGYQASPSAENALAAARILCGQQRYEEARPLLEYVISHDQGAKRDRARELLAESAS